MINMASMRKTIQKYIPHDKFSLNRLTIKEDGEKGYRVTLYNSENNLHLFNYSQCGLDLLMNKDFYEPDYRKEILYIKKDI